jgi:hypothetical protein
VDLDPVGILDPADPLSRRLVDGLPEDRHAERPLRIARREDREELADDVPRAKPVAPVRITATPAVG